MWSEQTVLTVEGMDREMRPIHIKTEELHCIDVKHPTKKIGKERYTLLHFVGV